jgi:hypothetical protein
MENIRVQKEYFANLIWTDNNKFLKLTFQYKSKRYRKKYGKII